MADAGDGRNSMMMDVGDGGYINYLEIIKSAFIPALFFVIGFIIGRIK